MLNKPIDENNVKHDRNKMHTRKTEEPSSSWRLREGLRGKDVKVAK